MKGLIETLPRAATHDRTKYIGASEAAAVLGLSEFETGMGVWSRKTQGLDTFGGNASTRRGHYLESGLLRWTADECGATKTEPGIPISEPGVQGPESWMAYHPDGALLVNGLWRLAEIKTGRKAGDWGDEDSGEIPLGYLTQVQYQMACTPGVDEVVVGAYLPVQDSLKVYKIARDSAFIEWMTNEIGRWVEKHLVQGIAPPIDGTSASTSYLTKRFPKELTGLRDASPREIRMVLDLAAAKAELKALEEQIELLANQLKEKIGDAEGLRVAGGKVTWKYQNGANRVDTKALEADHPELVAKYKKQGDALRVMRLALKKGE